MSQNTSAASPTQPARNNSISLLIIGAAFLLLTWAVSHAAPLQSANDRSRWCTVWSLVERGTYQIDEIDKDPRWSTIDKVRHREKGDQPWHFYSSKPPLFPTLVAGVYWVLKHVGGMDLRQDTELVTRVILFLFNVLPMTLALMQFRWSLHRLKVSPAAENALVFSAAFASMLNPFLTTLNNHTPAAVCLVFSLAAIVRLQTSSQLSSRDFAVVGLTAALTCCFELPAALFGVVSFFLMLRVDWKKTAKWYVPAALLPLAAFFLTNWICTGGLKPFYAYYGTEKYRYIHEGVPSYWMEPKGIDANRESTVVYLFHCLVGHHGLLSLTPVYLLTLAGWAMTLRAGSSGPRRTIARMGAAISAAILVFYLTRTQNYNYGGNSSALRWMLWLTPFWWYGMIPAVEYCVARRWGRVLIVLLLIPSVYSSIDSLNRPWQPNWIFRQMQRAGWIDYGTRIPPFDPPRYALITQLPTQRGVQQTFRGAVKDSAMILAWKVEDEIALSDTTARRMTVEMRSAGETAADAGADVTRTAQILVDPAGPRSGKDVDEWVRDAEDVRKASSSERRWADLSPAPEWVRNLLRGMPRARPYNSASPRWFQYTDAGGMKTAIRCERGASRVPVEHPDYGRCWHRCDVLYSSRVPFGVVNWHITVVQEKTNKVVHSETWTARELPSAAENARFQPSASVPATTRK